MYSWKRNSKDIDQPLQLSGLRGDVQMPLDRQVSNTWFGVTSVTGDTGQPGPSYGAPFILPRTHPRGVTERWG